MPSSIILRGTCACTSTNWTSTSPPAHLDFCYCSQCQRVSGAPFVAWMGIDRQSLAWSGSYHTFRLHISDGMDSIATRSCCSECGGTMSMQYDCYPEKTHVTASTVVEDVTDIMKTLKPGDHIFLKDKPEWYRIPEDNAPRYEGFDQSFLDRQTRWDEEQKYKRSQVSEVEPPDNEFHEENEEIRFHDDTIHEAETSANEESDEEIQRIRRQYGGTQRQVSVAIDDFDSD